MTAGRRHGANGLSGRIHDSAGEDPAFGLAVPAVGNQRECAAVNGNDEDTGEGTEHGDRVVGREQLQVLLAVAGRAVMT